MTLSFFLALKQQYFYHNTRKSTHLLSSFNYLVVFVQSPSHVQIFATPWTASCPSPSCPSPSPRICPSSCSLHQWCHPAISSSDALFSFYPQSFPALGTFPLNFLCTSDWSFSFSISSSIEYSGLISLKIDWFNLAVQGTFRSLQFKGINSLEFCLLYGPGLTTVYYQWEDHSLDFTDLCQRSNVSTFQHTV